MAIPPRQRGVERWSACGVRAPPVGVPPVEGDEDCGVPLAAWFHVKRRVRRVPSTKRQPSRLAARGRVSPESARVPGACMSKRAVASGPPQRAVQR